MIVSFKDKATRTLFETGVHPKLGNIARSGLRKLRILDATDRLDALHIPAGNRLEALSGNRKGQFSIRINDQWRICFVWVDGNARDVEIVDYH